MKFPVLFFQIQNVLKLSIYFFDKQILYYLFDDINLSFKFNDYLNRENKPEIGDILFNANKLNGNISLSLHNPYKERKIVLKGEKGILYYNPLEKNSLKYFSISKDKKNIK